MMSEIAFEAENVVLHEFAHQNWIRTTALQTARRCSATAPVTGCGRRCLGREFEALRVKASRGEGTLLMLTGLARSPDHW